MSLEKVVFSFHSVFISNQGTATILTVVEESQVQNKNMQVKISLEKVE